MMHFASPLKVLRISTFRGVFLRWLMSWVLRACPRANFFIMELKAHCHQADLKGFTYAKRRKQ
jgi:hypothetical protein